MSAPVENLVRRLNAKRIGRGWIAKCPAHDDRTPSLSIDEGTDGRALIKCHAGCNTNDVIAALGMTPSDLFPATSHRHSNNGNTARISRLVSESRSTPVLDWRSCVEAFSQTYLEGLAKWRGYSSEFCSWLKENRLVGLCNGCIAFPVRDGTSNVVAVHFRMKDGSWRYAPQGTNVQPFVIGELIGGDPVHVFESQWDAFAFMDKSGEYNGIIVTRGASNGALVAGLISESSTVFAWTQNDEAGAKWQKDICANTKATVKRVRIPAPHKDLNAWAQTGAKADDLFAAMINAPVISSTAQPLAATLDSIVAFLRRYVVFPLEEQPTAVSLWVAHAWALDAFDYTPYLHVVSPEKQCGKTRLLDCLELLTPKPWRAVLPSEAVLFRNIEKDRPTLLLDELDAIFRDGKDDRKEALRALLNAGFEEKARIPRCVGQNLEVKNFRVFCPKALAGIGKLPDTVRDRCIPIRLVRRARDERVEKFRKREAERTAATIQCNLAALSGNTRMINILRDSRPETPDELSDRQADICEPLLAVAELAGGKWPELSRRALVALCTESDDEESVGAKLLSAIREAFDADGNDKLPTQQLLRTLIAQETDAPWATWWEHEFNNGNVLGPAQKLARLLKPYHIQARGIRLPDNTTPRGYMREDFAEAWKRYCPPKATQTATMQHN